MTQPKDTDEAPDMLKQALALPPLPGVYRYFDSSGQLLYVGKARNLKKRVASYFNREHGGTRIGHMVSKAIRMETTVVRSEAEALLLENNLIKSQHPKYNILFRDDKSYPYLRVTATQPPGASSRPPAAAFSRISYYRGGTDRLHHYFGPYPNVWAVRETIQLLQRVFLLRTCEDTVFNNRTRPCLLYQIKRCSGPCAGLISPAAYRQDTEQAMQLLRGQTDTLLRKLETSMMEHAQEMEYEQAALLRDRIASLSTIMQQQSMDTISDADVDIVAVRHKDGKACVNLAMVRGGRHLGDRAYFPTQLEAALAITPEAESPEAESPETVPPEAAQAGTQSANAAAAPALSEAPPDGKAKSEKKDRTHTRILEAFVTQHYLSYAPPPLLVTSHCIDPELLDLLSQQTGKRIKNTFNPRGERRVWLEMAQHNAELQLSRLLSEEGSQKARTQALAEALDMDLEDAALAELRIECFDISHTAGEATQASCVVFQRHLMQSSEYRRYKVSGITPGDDYAAMRQVLMRRYGRLAQSIQNATSTALPEPAGPAEPPAPAESAEQAAQAPGPAREPGITGGNHDRARMPDLVLIDGGKGQISAAREVFEQLGLDIGLLIGVEKGEGRKVGLEELVFADGRPKKSLPPTSAALLLIAQIRDEAHRFAITGMRAQRARVRTGGSHLEEIAGIGPKRRARLLQRFGGVQGVARASVEDLMTVEGISGELAKTIYQALHQ